MRIVARVIVFLWCGSTLFSQQLPPPLSTAELTIWMDARIAPMIPSAPNPPHAATGIAITPRTLSWTAIGGTSYNVCFHTSSTFPANTCRVVTTNTWTTPALTANTTYYWRVVARNTYTSNGTGGPTWNFRTAAIPAPPPLALACPANPAPVTATSTSGIVVTLPQASVSGGTPPYTVTYTPASGTVFPVGVTTVNVSATDAGTQSRTCMFNVTVNAPPTPQPPPDGYVAEFWNSNANTAPVIPTGSVVFSRVDPTINFNWGADAPAANVQMDYWLARWTRTVTLTAGVYQFSVTSDDGVRVWVDNTLLIDDWTNHSATTRTANLTVTAGSHNLRIEYFEAGGLASLQFTYVTLQTPVATLPATFVTSPYQDLPDPNAYATHFRFYDGNTSIQQAARAQAINAAGQIQFIIQPGQLTLGSHNVSVSAIADLNCIPVCETSSAPYTVVVQ